MTASILVVEDNADSLKLITWALEDQGYTSKSVPCAEDAIELLGRERFSLVLMDIALPGMDGKEATRWIRANPPTAALPVIAVTAHAVLGETDAILESGVSALMTKPIDEDRLLGAIAALLSMEVGDGQDPRR
jgi:two-component system cell cycle response regulator DivK